MFRKINQDNRDGSNDDVSSKQPTPSSSKQEAEEADLLDAYSRAVIQVVDTTTPAVVSVSTHDNRLRKTGTGSGVVLASDGLIVTNSHVVAGHDKVKIELHDGDVMDGVIIGDDPSTDLAAVKIKTSDLASVSLGDSHTLRVGQLVIAVGSPLGLSATVSTGIVSATGRSMRGQDGRLIENIVQHTAPINPGNSGGPLVDSRGNVIGINTAIIQYAQNLGFAVSSSTVNWVLGEFLEHGCVRRRQLGITASTIKLYKRQIVHLDLVSETAVQIVDVDQSGAAWRSGLRPNDIITSINGRIIANIDEIHRLLSLWSSNQTLEVEIIRGERIVSMPLNF